MSVSNPIRIEFSLGIMFPSVNAYLVPGDALTLVDCGWNSPENWAQLQEGFTQQGYTLGDLQKIIITHEHQDHIGLLPLLLQHTEAEVYAPQGIKKWLFHADEARIGYFSVVMATLKATGMPPDALVDTKRFLEAVRTYPDFLPHLERFHFFIEGDYLTFGQGTWQALNTPGHCPTQFVFFDEEGKRLLSGDMLLPVAPMPIITEDPARPGQVNEPLRELIASFHRLKALDIETVYPGHGSIFTDAHATIDRQLARIEQRKGECLQAIQEGHRTTYTIKRKMYPGQITPPNLSGLYMVLGYLDLLETEGKIMTQADEEGILYFQTC